VKRKRGIYVSAPLSLSLFPMKKKRVVVGDKKKKRMGLGKRKKEVT
jgi:hypothetical protein